MPCSICRGCGHNKLSCPQNPLSKTAIAIVQKSKILASAKPLPKTFAIYHEETFLGRVSETSKLSAVKIEEKKEKKVVYRPTPTYIDQKDNFYGIEKPSKHPIFGYAEPPTPLTLLCEDGMCEMVETDFALNNFPTKAQTNFKAMYEARYWDENLTLLSDNGLCEMVETDYRPKTLWRPLLRPKIPEYEVHRNAKSSGDGRENPLLLAMRSKNARILASMTPKTSSLIKIASKNTKQMISSKYKYDSKNLYQDLTNSWR